MELPNLSLEICFRNILGAKGYEKFIVAFKKIDCNLHSLMRFSEAELIREYGMTANQVTKVKSSLALINFYNLEDSNNLKQVRSSKNIYQILRPYFDGLSHEEFYVILLNRGNRVIGVERISIGGVAGTVVDVKIIFKKALDVLAENIILAHNHPSGNLTPSISDKQITQKIKTAAKTMDIHLLDHLIMTDYNYCSFADEGIL